MRCTSLAILLGVILFAYPGSTSANPPCESPYGSGSGWAINMFSRIHQHGPLFNYGPYYGYPPFEPYGPWNAYLQYNPWYYGVPGAGGHHCAGCSHDFMGHGPLNWHSSWFLGGWYHGCSTCSHGGLFTSHGGWIHGSAKPCNSCGITGSVSEMAAPTKASFNAETTDPVTRYAGVGNATDFSCFYSGLPALDLTAVVPAGGIAK